MNKLELKLFVNGYPGSSLITQGPQCMAVVCLLLLPGTVPLIYLHKTGEKGYSNTQDNSRLLQSNSEYG